MIDVGRYLARAIDWQLGFAETGTEQVSVTFEIVEECEYQGHTITWIGYLTDATSERTLKALIVCGWASDDLADLAGVDRNQVELVVEHEIYNGVKRARVKWINRPGVGGFVMKHPMTDAQKKALSQKMKGLVVTLRKEEGAGRVREPQAAAPATRPQSGATYPEDWDGQGLGGL